MATAERLNGRPDNSQAARAQRAESVTSPPLGRFLKAPSKSIFLAGAGVYDADGSTFSVQGDNDGGATWPAGEPVVRWEPIGGTAQLLELFGRYVYPTATLTASSDTLTAFGRVIAWHGLHGSREP